MLYMSCVSINLFSKCVHGTIELLGEIKNAGVTYFWDQENLTHLQGTVEGVGSSFSKLL